jgi:hypothetical protein
LLIPKFPALHANDVSRRRVLQPLVVASFYYFVPYILFLNPHDVILCAGLIWRVKCFPTLLIELHSTNHNESPQEHITNIVRMDQDWTPVVLQKTTKQKVAGMSSAHAVAAQKMAGVMTTEKKFDAAQNKSAHSGSGAGMKKLEESTEEFKHNTVSQDLSKAISQAR